MSKIIETVHISYHRKTILTFRVEISQTFGDDRPTANVVLTHIGGADRPFPEEPTWEELGSDYLTDYFESHTYFTLEDYEYGIRNAEATALSRITRA